MESFDRLIPALMEKYDIPGGAIAVARNGKLILARGYGLADVECGEPVQPDSIFRIASISKPITAVGILKLVEDGRLSLDDRAFDILDQFEPPGGTVEDPRINEVTVRHLLQHSGGWDSGESFDPMFASRLVESELGVEKPVSCGDVIRFMLGQPLDFDPGSKYAYSNFGYCILGRIIEETTGQQYDEYIKSQILEPLGITRMDIGGTLLKDRADGEVHYYGYSNQSLGESVLPDTPEFVPWQYGGFYLRALDAHGGWIASPIDLVRFATALDGSKPPLILKPETVAAMASRPDLPLGTQPTHYGMGWSIRPIGFDANWWHNGSLPGTTTLLVRTSGGLSWAALFNSRPRDWQQLNGELDRVIWQAVEGVSGWPSHNLFSQYRYE